MSGISKIIKAGTRDTHDYAIHETREGINLQISTFAVTVASRNGGYVVTEIDSLQDAEMIAEVLPAPSPINNGARLFGVVTTEFPDGAPEHTHHFLLENRDDAGAFDYEKLYDVGGLSSGEALETEASRPDLAIVAIDETANWASDVVAVCGRIKGVYGINRNDKAYAQVWMEFLSNQFERPMIDLDEAQIDAEFQKIGYDTQTDFEMDNSGDQGREIGRWAVDRLETLEVLTPSSQWLVEHMLEPSEGRRLELEREYYAEVMANGLPGVKFDEARSDAEIIGDTTGHAP